jgi:hypothetical protein
VFRSCVEDGFADRYVAPILSHQRHGTSEIFILTSLRRGSTHITYVVAFTKALYSAFVHHIDTVGFLQALQDMRFDPKHLSKPPVDLLS